MPTTDFETCSIISETEMFSDTVFEIELKESLDFTCVVSYSASIFKEI